MTPVISRRSRIGEGCLAARAASGAGCTPLDPEDFAPTQARPGWPITFAEMDAYVPDALEFLDAGSTRYSAAEVMPTHPLPLDPTQTDLVVDRIERFSLPINVWRKFSTALENSPDIPVIYSSLHERAHQCRRYPRA
jgi:hypothetical protein